MKKIICLIILLSIRIIGYTQDSINTFNSKIKIDVQAFGNSPIFSIGVGKNFIINKKGLGEIRIGFGFYPEYGLNKYPNNLGTHWIEKNEPSLAYNIPLEFTYNPNYKNKFSFSIGLSYNRHTFNDVYTNMNDPSSPTFLSFIHKVERLTFTIGSDYIIKKKLYLGARIILIHDFELGFGKINIPITPSIRYKF